MAALSSRKRKDRRNRRRSVSREVLLPLSPDQGNSLLALLPKNRNDPRDPAVAQRVLEWIEDARRDFHQIVRSGVDAWETRKARGAVTIELNDLANTATKFLNAVRKLSPYGQLLITRNPETWFTGHPTCLATSARFSSRSERPFRATKNSAAGIARMRLPFRGPLRSQAVA